MAINQLKVSSDELKAKAEQMDTCANNIQTQVGTILTTVGEINQAWSGDAASQYVNRFKELNDDMAKMMEMTREYATDLKAVADNYAQVEQANSQVTASLKTDVIG